MGKEQAYKLTIGLLVALLVVFNVIVPYVQNRNAEQRAVATASLMQSMVGLDENVQNQMAMAFVKKYNKNIGMSADASYNSTFCSIYQQMLSNLTDRGKSYQEFVEQEMEIEARISKYCGGPTEPLML